MQPNYYMPNGYRPYGYQPQFNYQQQMQQPIQQPVSQIMQQQVGLQGKMIDNIDVVKSLDIPLDGSISYFPTTDGTSIVTKQLQMDGTSKIIIYKPFIDKEQTSEKSELPNYITIDDFNKGIDKLDNSNLINELKKDIEELKETFKKSNTKKG